MSCRKLHKYAQEKVNEMYRAKTYGGVDVRSQPFLNLELDGGAQPALLLGRSKTGEELQVSIGTGSWVGSRTRLGALEKKHVS